VRESINLEEDSQMVIEQNLSQEKIKTSTNKAQPDLAMDEAL